MRTTCLYHKIARIGDKVTNKYINNKNIKINKNDVTTQHKINFSTNIDVINGSLYDFMRRNSNTRMSHIFSFQLQVQLCVGICVYECIHINSKFKPCCGVLFSCSGVFLPTTHTHTLTHNYLHKHTEIACARTPICTVSVQ